MGRAPVLPRLLDPQSSLLGVLQLPPVLCLLGRSLPPPVPLASGVPRGAAGVSPFASDPSPLGGGVAGCLGRHWEGWLSIGAEQWVVDVLRDGYRIPFSAPPPLTLVYRDHRAYAPGSRKFRALQDELLQLLAKGAIEEAPPSPGFYSHLFVVPKVTGGFRPIIDLSALNRFVATTKFKMETIRTVMAAVRQGDWMVSLDLQDAYLQVPVHPDSRRFLRFTWGSSAWQFRVLCFGLSTAPQVFTRIMAPVSAEFHRRGFRLLRYLDDWLLLAASEGQARAATSCLLSLCVQLGIRVNWK